MPRKGHSQDQVLNKLRQVEVAVASGKSVEQAVRDIGVTDHPPVPEAIMPRLRLVAIPR
jgi:hypothetical protein